MNKKVDMYLTVFIVFMLFLVLISKYSPTSFADPDVHEISNFEDLVQFAELSRMNGYQDDTYVLTDDIVITEENKTSLESSSFKYISFGTSDLPFTGTFDGDGHEISGLSYSSNLDVITDTGLIKEAGPGAVIKDLVISNADLSSDYRGGIVVGKATGALIENVVVKDSKLFVSATNNVVSLITDGGIRGGAIVGEAFDSVLYNCESNNTTVNTNNTAGVAALSGKGLTLGGLVGKSDNTLVEYSRVYGGTVKSYYDVAVGALGGNTLYVGGIVGQMSNSSKVIDSFSTASLDFYCATYVSVGAGNSGHIGGITAAMNGTTNEIIRSHYAGVATSKQYNAILVIPIIETNKNISGIADIYDGGSVVNSYFNKDLNPDVKMNVLGSSSSTSSYGAQTSDRYVSKDFWQSGYYDFTGVIERNTDYSSSHFNKWVMNNELGMPVHGKGVSATLDFKGAGEVTIGPSELINSSVSTKNPYVFATQGLNPSEIKTSISATENEGYRFIGWYKVPDISTWKINEDHDYFDEIFSENEMFGTSKSYNEIEAEDNDLFVAYYKARVLFHDIEGNVIGKDGSVISDTDIDENWYDYGDKIRDVIPKVTPESENASLIGWTSLKSSYGSGGYPSITSAELSNLKEKNAFYETGDLITSTLDLYPVYADLISNVNTIFEGNELDSSSNASLREGVGSTSVKINDDGKVVLSVTGDLENGAFPSGYRFLGWYDENGYRVSKDKNYEVEEIDLSSTHEFTARFEYEVQYYVRAYAQDSGNAFTESLLYASRWQKYNSAFVSIPTPGYIREHITHWGNSHVNHGSSDSTVDSYSSNITSPVKVYSHNYESATGNNTTYHVSMDTDFPGSGGINDEHRTAGALFQYTPVSDRYHLLFWTFERKREGWTYVDNPMNTGVLDTTVTYQGQAVVTTDVVFHKKSGLDITVTRRYKNNIFMDSDTVHTYKYPYMHTDTNVSTSPEDGSSGDVPSSVTLGASPSRDSMKIDGYAFLGWISSSDVAVDSKEWNHIYDVSGDLYCTSDIDNAIPYLISSDAVVTETLDLYPVYAKYNIETTTNVSESGVSEGINFPDDPTYVLEEKEELGKAVVTISLDNDTFVVGDSGTKYELKSLTISYDDRVEEIILKDGVYKYDIEAGKEYTITANYIPLVIVYHLNDSENDVVFKEEGDLLGVAKDPTYDIDSEIDDSSTKYLFVGYTKTKPSSGYHKFSDYNSFQKSGTILVNQDDLVYKSMELWPVYVGISIKVNSNIDDYLTSSDISLDSVRTLKRASVSKMSLEILDDNIEDYYFTGWYKNYVDKDNKGTLVSDNINYIFETNESFTNDVYTAVYEKMYHVKYHDKEGNVIYDVTIHEDEERSFVKQVRDNDDALVYSFIDYDAISNLSDSLGKNEIFKAWTWVKSDGTVVPWEDYYDKIITGNMDLYPVITSISAKDYDDKEIDVSSGDTIVVGMSDDTLYAELNTLYKGSKLTINVSEISYLKDDTLKENIENMEVVLSSNGIDKSLGTEKTNSSGDAIFTLRGIVTITRELDEKAKSGDIFVYKITSKDNHQEVLKVVTLKSGESVNVIVPYGDYYIYEDEGWYWRHNEFPTGDLSVNNYGNDDIVFSNGVMKSKWVDRMTDKNNLYR